VLDGVPFIRAADMSSGVVDFDSAGKIDGVARRRIRKGVGAPGDVILSHKGTVGRVAVAPDDSPDFVCSPQTTFWRSLDRTVLDQRFLKFVLLSADFARQLDMLKSQTDMAPYVSLTDQRSMELHLPEIEEQCAISDVLGALDEKIVANDNLVVLLARVLSVLVEDAGKIDGIDCTLDHVARFHNRKRIPLSAADRALRIGSVPYYGATGCFGFVDEALFDEPLVLVGEDGSVITETGNPVVQYIWGPAWVNNHAHVLTAVGISTELLSIALRSSDVRSLVTGAVQPKVSMGNLKRLRVRIPDNRRLPQLETTISMQMALHRSLAAESESLASLRDLLLPELMSGRVRVKDADAVAESVL